MSNMSFVILWLTGTLIIITASHQNICHRFCIAALKQLSSGLLRLLSLFSMIGLQVLNNAFSFQQLQSILPIFAYTDPFLSPFWVSDSGQCWNSMLVSQCHTYGEKHFLANKTNFDHLKSFKPVLVNFLSFWESYWT